METYLMGCAGAHCHGLLGLRERLQFDSGVRGKMKRQAGRKRAFHGGMMSGIENGFLARAAGLTKTSSGGKQNENDKTAYHIRFIDAGYRVLYEVSTLEASRTVPTTTLYTSGKW